jgi:hypothetical protein
MKGRRIPWNEFELAFIKARCTMPRSELHAEFCRVFNRTDVSQQSITSLCKRNGWLTGRDGRFTPGQEAMNKGKPMPYHPNSAATRFRPGQTPLNRKPLWDERLCQDGYIEMKVPLTDPYTGFPTRYMHKHRYLWEQENGLLPKGMALKCLDGNRRNCDPSNWKAIPRGLLPRLNGKTGRNYDTAPDEVKPTILAIAQLEQALSDARKGRGEEQEAGQC